MKTAASIIFAAIALLIGALFAGKYYLESDAAQQKIEASLGKVLGVEVSLQQPLALSVWPTPKITLQGLRVANADGVSAPENFLQMQTLTLVPLLRSLSELRLVLALRHMANGQLNFALGPDGQGNWPKLQPDQGKSRQWVRLQGWDNAHAENIKLLLPGKSENRLHIQNLQTSAAGSNRVIFTLDAAFRGEPLRGEFTLPGLQALRVEDKAGLTTEIKTLTWGKNDVTGTLTLHRAATREHRLTGELQSALMVAQATSADPKTNASAQAEGPINLPKVAIPTAWRKFGNVDIHWRVDKLRAGLASATDITLRVRSEGNSLIVDPLNFQLDNALANTRLTLDVPQQTPSVAYAGRIDNLDISERISAFSGQGEDRGYLTTVFDLYGTGGDTRTAILNLNGDLRLVLEEGQFSTALLNRIAIDLGRLMGLASKVEGATPVRCLAIQARADDGVITIQRLLMDTATLVLTGQGTIDLRSGEIELSINPSSEGLSLTQLQAPIDIRGSLSAPKSSLDLSAFAAEAAATIVPNFLNEEGPIADLLGPSSDKGGGCVATLREYQSR